MANGFRRRGSSDYVFVNGRAVRSQDVMDSSVQETAVPGRNQDMAVPGSTSVVPGQEQPRAARRSARSSVKDMASDDAFALREGAQSGALLGGIELMGDDKRKMRRLYLVFGLVLVVCAAVSFCADPIHLDFRSPVEVVQGWGAWISVQFASIFRPQDVADARLAAATAVPDYEAIVFQAGSTLKYLICGVMLAVSGMLYQNAFRNPIAAPSMLGVTNGISFAVLALVLQFGIQAYSYIGLYYLYSYIAGVLVLVLVMLGGKWTSGHRKFNVVNMILIGTIASQMLGVLTTYVQDNFMSDTDWQVYNELVQALNITSVWTYVSLIVGALAALVPVYLFRFRLNLVSFSDEETKFLGVDPTKLRLLALGCGSIMILTAQVNAGQVAMISLVVPFVVRAVFGSEFRKQLGGNILVGSIILVICGLLSNYIIVNDTGIGLGPITTIIALPLFVWMLAIRQRSWD